MSNYCSPRDPFVSDSTRLPTNHSIKAVLNPDIMTHQGIIHPVLSTLPFHTSFVIISELLLSWRIVLHFLVWPVPPVVLCMWSELAKEFVDIWENLWSLQLWKCVAIGLHCDLSRLLFVGTWPLVWWISSVMVFERYSKSYNNTILSPFDQFSSQIWLFFLLRSVVSLEGIARAAFSHASSTSFYPQEMSQQLLHDGKFCTDIHGPLRMNPKTWSLDRFQCHHQVKNSFVQCFGSSAKLMMLPSASGALRLYQNVGMLTCYAKIRWRTW